MEYPSIIIILKAAKFVEKLVIFNNFIKALDITALLSSLQILSLNEIK